MSNQNTTENLTFSDISGTAFVILYTIVHFYQEEQFSEMHKAMQTALNFINMHGSSIAARVAMNSGIPISEADDYMAGTIQRCVDTIKSKVSEESSQ